MTARSRPPTPAHPRILISGGLAVGGPQTHLLNLCAILCEAGAEVTVASASTNWPAEAIARLKELGVRSIVSPFGFGAMRWLGKLWAILAWPLLLRRDYDLLYCVGEGKMHLWASRFIPKGGWKIYHELVESPQNDSVAARVAAHMDAIIANSKPVAEALRLLLPEKPVVVIPFLTSSGPIEAAKPRGGPGQHELRVAFLGRLVPHKRPQQLIDAWPQWITQATIGPARLDIHGGDYDNEASKMRAQIEKLGLQDSVRLCGTYSTKDLPRIMAETDIVVLPSLYEGLPLVLVEAMLRGIPVVATSAGGTAELGEGNPDVIITRGTGWNEFADGLAEMAQRVRAGKIDNLRLQCWTEARYGFATVAAAWGEALLVPNNFFVGRSIAGKRQVRP